MVSLDVRISNRNALWLRAKPKGTWNQSLSGFVVFNICKSRVDRMKTRFDAGILQVYQVAQGAQVLVSCTP